MKSKKRNYTHTLYNTETSFNKGVFKDIRTKSKIVTVSHLPDRCLGILLCFRIKKMPDVLTTKAVGVLTNTPIWQTTTNIKTQVSSG